MGKLLKTLRILIIEDNPVDAGMILNSAKATQEFTVQAKVKSSLKEGLAELGRTAYNLILLDLNLPDSEGMNTVTTVLKSAGFTPVVIMSGMEDIDLAVRSLRLGAADYLPKKELNGAVLEKVITYAIEKVRRQNQEKLVLDLLEILSWSGSFTDTVKRILELIRIDLAVGAVGMRFRDGSDFPFLFTSGFSDSFVNAENSLCDSDVACDPVSGGNLDSRLSCFCGMVIEGKTDPAFPCFTAGGSFVSNGANDFEGAGQELSDFIIPRSSCLKYGYESVAIIPIRIEDEIIGTLQLNDPEKNRFSTEMIAGLEKIVGSIGITLKRNAAEEALKESETRLNTILENIQAAVVIINPQTHRIIYANRNSLDMTGRDMEEMIGSLCCGLICPAQLGHCPITDLNEHYVHTESVVLHKSGSSIPVIKTVATVMVNNSELLLETFIDITHLKDVEERLVREKERAELSDKLKTSFINNISHEIRTPLNGILGFTTMLIEEGLVNIKGREFAQVIESCSDHLLRIMSDIMDYSLIENDNLFYKSGNIRINPVLDHCKVFIDSLIVYSKKPISVEIHKPLSDGNDLVWADEKRLEQILRNLLDNAHKFTDKGNIEFGYEVDGNDCIFFVRDTGIGIPTDKLSVIFEKFRQADEASARLYGGTGLGLPICKGIVRLFGGRIWAESTLGSGSGFMFTVPLKES